jgi:hypothetical protein
VCFFHIKSAQVNSETAFYYYLQEYKKPNRKEHEKRAVTVIVSSALSFLNCCLEQKCCLSLARHNRNCKERLNL